MLRAGVDLAVVSTVGHSSIALTGDIYAQLLGGPGRSQRIPPQRSSRQRGSLVDTAA
jgi:hypothetical protein